MTKSVGVAILTWNSSKHIARCLQPLIASPLKPSILIVDSSSKDNTVQIAQDLGVDIHIINQADFNHGETRELARNLLGTDIVVMVTPDAYAIDNHVLEVLIQPIIQGKAAAAYARQIPRDNAGFFEAFPREFNYPAASQIRSIEDVEQYGIYTFFCSDSFAAYSNKALSAIDGFKTVLLGEDNLAVAQLLRKGYKVAYVAEAVVKHSHDYSIKQEFCRYFDTGLARTEYQSWLDCGHTDSKRGKEFIQLMFKRLCKERPYLLPYAFVQSFAKWLGYQLGTKCINGPVWLNKLLSSQPTYWSSNAFLRKQEKSFRKNQ